MTLSDRLLSRVRKARSICVLTGAGISAESGVPTFRGAGGLWKTHRPEQLATADAFRRDPELVWEWYHYRRKIVLAAEPNAGHRAIAAWEKAVPELTLVTQNVDGLHRRAGSKRVLELHGTLHRAHCFRECGNQIDTLPDSGVPGCICGGAMRPSVVWFGESLSESVLSAAMEAVSRCDLLVSVGTSGVVYPAAALPAMAKVRGAFVVEVNAERTEVSDSFDEVVIGKAGEVLPLLVQSLGTGAHS